MNINCIFLRLLFRGTKTFWKTKSSIYLIIVEYAEYEIYVIIACDPVLRIHAPRLYINSRIIQSILNHSTSNSIPVGVVDGAVTTFLFNHLVITEYLPESKSIKLDIRPIFLQDKCADGCMMITTRPAGLPRYPSPFVTLPK